MRESRVMRWEEKAWRRWRQCTLEGRGWRRAESREGTRDTRRVDCKRASASCFPTTSPLHFVVPSSSTSDLTHIATRYSPFRPLVNNTSTSAHV